MIHRKMVLSCILVFMDSIFCFLPLLSSDLVLIVYRLATMLFANITPSIANKSNYLLSVYSNNIALLTRPLSSKCLAINSSQILTMKDNINTKYSMNIIHNRYDSNNQPTNNTQKNNCCS